MPAADDFATFYYPVGVVIGLASAAPIGPVNLLVIQQALGARRGAALLLGGGGAIGDGLFAAAAAFGVGAVSRLLQTHGLALRLAGSIIMLAFAVVIWRAAPRLRADEAPLPPVRMALATLTLTLTNPATLFFFLGAFGAVGFVAIGHDTPLHRQNAALVVAGTFSGSMLWWIAVVSVSYRLRHRIADHNLVQLNRMTAALLGVFAIGVVGAGAMRS